MRFLGLELEDRVPDAKTVWLFRERLKELKLVDDLFARFHEQLATRGYAARAGQMIDATFVEVPRQRNTRDENAQVKAGETPADWQMPVNKSKLRQKHDAVGAVAQTGRESCVCCGVKWQKRSRNRRD